jgi:putative ABC transport system permease protein
MQLNLRIGKYLPVAFKSVQTRKLQTALSTLGIVIGVGAVMVAFSIVEGGKHEMMEKIRQLGANQLNIRNLDEDEAKMQRERHNPSRGLTLSDMGNISRELSQYISLISPILQTSRVLRNQGREMETGLIGASAEFLALHKLHVAAGRFLSARDIQDSSRVVVLGSAVRKALFPFGDAVGKSIRVGGDWFKVIGVLQSRDTKKVKEIPSQYYYNSKAFIPYSTAQLSRGRGAQVDRLDLALFDSADIGAVARAADRILERLHYRVRDFRVTVPGDLLRHEQQSREIFNLILLWSAILSLIVGGAGIMNVMLATVMERTMEVGLRRALGASRADIIQQFLSESVMLTLFGGLLGIAIGGGAALLISGVLGWQAVISLRAIALGLVSGLSRRMDGSDSGPKT